MHGLSYWIPGCCTGHSTPTFYSLLLKNNERYLTASFYGSTPCSPTWKTDWKATECMGIMTACVKTMIIDCLCAFFYWLPALKQGMHTVLMVELARDWRRGTGS